MKKIVLLIFLALMGCKMENTTKADIYTATINGRGDKVGTAVFADTDKGLKVQVDLHDLPAGKHGFHIHENPDCGPKTDDKGQVQAALKAGGHYDPDNTGKHLGPNGHGHRGDLPVLDVLPDGTVKTEFYLPNLTVAEIKNRSLMIHAGGDNYKDTPMPLGGGGARIACGIIE